LPQQLAAFAIGLVLAAIMMYDAAGVRRAVSIQARILNQMIDEAFQGKPFAEKRLRELIGLSRSIDKGRQIV
jgi:uncharacterized protein